MSRTVSLVLVDPVGDLLGRLPPFTVESPWWQDVAGVVAGAGLDVTVLRLLHGDQAGDVRRCLQTAVDLAGQ